jgi:membrane peptidoglycan carboxypeptidase
MYCNQVYMGHGRYGLEAASQFYFGKHARELDLAESTLLAGLIQPGHCAALLPPASWERVPA